MSIWGRNTLVIIFTLMSASCYAQKVTTRMTAINYVLSDTLNPELFLIPINVKLKNSDSIWITYTSVLDLYEYCNEKHGWNRKLFIDRIGNIILYDKFLEVEKSFLLDVHRIPKNECDCLYRENEIQLRGRLSAGNYYKYPDNRFVCFLYKCLKNNIVIGSVGESGLIWTRTTDFTSE